MSLFLVGQTQSLTPIVFNEDKNALSKIGNINFFPQFGLLKQAARYSYLCLIHKQLVVNIYSMPIFQGYWCIFEDR